jgi:chemotaxis signal transduction protein
MTLPLRVDYLLVRAGARRVGLPLSQVVEVLDPSTWYPVPSVEPAVRGVTVVRGRLLPLVHLGALLEGRGCPPIRGEVAVLIQLGTRRICLEVDDAESVLAEAGFPVSGENALPWAAGVARLSDELIPLLDLTALGARFTESASA